MANRVIAPNPDGASRGAKMRNGRTTPRRHGDLQQRRSRCSFSTSPEPEAGVNQIVVDVKGADTCHTDVGYLDGTLTYVLGFTPITLGHEIAGVVSQLGTAVAGFENGQRVVMPATVAGPGTGTDGGVAEKVKAFDHQVIPLPDGIAWGQATPATDARMTSYYALRRGGVKAGIKFGLAIQFTKGLGAELHVAETNRGAWDRIQEFGVEGLAENTREFGDKALEVIVDYAGFGTTTDDAIETVGVNGTVVQVGMGVDRATTTLMLKQVNLLGSLGGTNEV